MTRPARIEWLLFFATWFAFAFFNQGGGWNQNARFAEVRAMVEERRLPIDHFLVYRRDGERLVRVPVDRAELEWQGKKQRLAWVDMVWNLTPVGDAPVAEGTELAAMMQWCSSGDIGYVPWTGHFHPNKPPGTSLLAVPGYALILAIERACGIDPDDWWWLTVNCWLTTALSVGLWSAIGCVVFFRLARDFGGGKSGPALAATLLMAFATTFWPFATILMDHNITAALLLLAFYLLHIGRSTWRCALAGLCGGVAVLTNNIAVFPVALLGLYALAATRAPSWNWRGAFAFCAGGVPAAVVLLAYMHAAFGKLMLNTDLQNPLFQDASGAFLGMFTLPNPYIVFVLTLSPMRGLFFLAPVLVFGAIGACLWLRGARAGWVALAGGVVAFLLGLGAFSAKYDGRSDLQNTLTIGAALALAAAAIFWVRALRESPRVAAAGVCWAIFGFFFLVNCSFNGFHAGFSAGPRYLVPGLVFLALPMVALLAHRAWQVVIAPFAAWSFAVHALLTATDAANPCGVGAHARVVGREEWNYGIVGEYAAPLFFRGRAEAMIAELKAQHLEKETARIENEIAETTEATGALEKMHAHVEDVVARGEHHPIPLATIEGPVSTNPVGVWEGLFNYEYWPPRTPQTRWASCNAGEFLFERSRWSLLPLALVSGGLLALAAAAARRADRA